ncbi:hypothetical protein MASR1M60_28940 [Rhodocyclaceae bacterium]
MANIASVLKQEITWLVRKELQTETESLGLKKHRERPGLWASVLASILCVSPKTIYN